MTLITYNFTTNGNPTDAFSVKFSDPSGIYGLIRRDTGEILVADGTDIPRTGLGVYQYTLVDPSPMPSGYEYWVEVIYPGPVNNIFRTHFLTGSGVGTPQVVEPTLAFTSLEEMQRYLGEAGVSLRTDDAADETALTDLINEVIEDATEMVELYVWGQYDRANLSASKWIRRRATLIAVHLLSQRRGNPSSFEFRYQQIIAELNLVLSRQVSIPNTLARESSAPSISNYQIDNRSLAPVSRVNPHTSVGTYPGQKTINIDPQIV